MLRSTALVIVLLLAGTPGVSLACEIWCNAPGADDCRHGVGCCQHSRDGACARPEIAATGSECGEAPSLSPFLNESRHTSPRPLVSTAAAHEWPNLFANRDHAGNWFIPGAGRGRPPALPTVLRI
jgi:hypothetical protein